MPPPPKPDPTVPIGNSLFVTKLGGTDGIRERLDKCFLDIPSAVAAAQAGDTVFVYPGNYSLTAAIPLKPGVNFQFLGRGSVTSLDDVFSDSGQTLDSDTIILARGWTFSAGDKVLDFSPKLANRKASLYFEFDALISNETVQIYAGEGITVLDGNLIHAQDGTSVQVNGGTVVIRNCVIRTDTLGNGDAIILNGILGVDNCFVHAAGGTVGTDAIGMDGGKLSVRNSQILSEGANALTLRASGSAQFFNCDVTGNDAALTVADALVIEADGCNFHCTGVGKHAVEIYRSSAAKIHLRGGKVSSVDGATDFDSGWGNGLITVAGTVWDRSKGLPSQEWIPGKGWTILP